MRILFFLFTCSLLVSCTTDSDKSMLTSDLLEQKILADDEFKSVIVAHYDFINLERADRFAHGVSLPGNDWTLIEQSPELASERFEAAGYPNAELIGNAYQKVKEFGPVVSERYGDFIAEFTPDQLEAAVAAVEEKMNVGEQRITKPEKY
jgi:hypothetical protein